MLTGRRARRAEYPELQQARTTLIAVTASFGGLALFIAMFVVASTMGLSIQQREREIALLRAVAATPGQIRRMIAWEAAIVGLVGSAAGVWPGAHPRPRARPRARAPRHRAADLSVHRRLAADRRGASVAASRSALLAVLAAGRRAARVPPTLALADAAVEPRLLGPGRVIGGLLALAGAVPLFAVSTTTRHPDTAAATSEMTAIFLVLAVGFLGPIVARVAARLLGPPLARLSPVGGFLASANLRHRHAALLVGHHAAGAHGRDELHAAVQHDDARPRGQRSSGMRGLTGELAVTERRSGPAAGGAGRRARHARRALGGRADADHARPEPRRLR